jgi:hypothetical protein
VNFPAYVPVAVRAHIEKLIDGDGHGFKGWAAAAQKPGNEWIASVVAFLRRFQKKDERIKAMFQHLDEAGLSESSQKDFVNVAWLALTDYSKYRDMLDDADKQRKAIAKRAKELAKLLRSIMTDNSLIGTPMEFYSVRTLLRETDGDDKVWPLMREKLLPVPGDPEANGLDYIWGIAPKVPDLLDTVAKVADEYQPQFGGRIGAAIEKRERNSKTQFLRAFGHELAEARIEPNPEVINAMAYMATVALDNIDVTYGDVTQALDLKGTGAAG